MWRFEKEVQAAWSAADKWVKDKEGAIAEQWNNDSTQLAMRYNSRSISELLSHKDMYPSIPVIYWVADAVGWHDSSALFDISTGAFLAYLFIRLQDDIMDSQAETTGGLLVGNVCLEGFYSRYRKHFPSDHNFWEVWNDLMERYSESTLWELRKRKEERVVFSTCDLEKLGDKFLPAAAPPAAVAYLSGDDHLIEPIIELTTSLGRGLQLVNDHTGLVHDFETGNYTSVINDILWGVPKNRRMEELAFPHRTLITDAMERNLRRSKIFFRCATATAQKHKIPHVSEYVSQHEQYLNGEIARLECIREQARAMDREEPQPQISALITAVTQHTAQNGK